ncbi:hypothetical protein ACSS6W_002843 [Trichoderma asperelloides]
MSYSTIIACQCNHFYLRQCSLCITDSDVEIPTIKDAWSPQWLLKSFDDEDDNKAAAAKTLRYRIKLMLYTLSSTRLGDYKLPCPELPPIVRPFRWLISYHVLPKGCRFTNRYQTPPWRMLLRCLLIDLPSQLASPNHLLDIKSWKQYSLGGKNKVHDYTEENPYNITCGKRVVFSKQTKGSKPILCGDWLFVAYLWSADRAWVEHINVADLLNFAKPFCIQGWEWADTVGASADKPILFHELKTREENSEWEDYGVSAVRRSFPNSRERLSELRRLVNLHASDLL